MSAEKETHQNHVDVADEQEDDDEDFGAMLDECA
jgi:hypothetical protein